MRVTLRTLCVLLLLVVPASAQLSQATRVMTKDVRLGTYTTASVTVPVDAETLHVTGVMSPAEASDPANQVIIIVMASRDRVTWSEIQREYWQGGTFIPKGGTQPVPAYIDFAFGGLTTWQLGDVRAEVDVRSKTNVGLELTFLPKPQGGGH